MPVIKVWCLPKSTERKLNQVFEIIIEVTGLFKKPERTIEVRNRLAERLGKTLKEHFPKAMVECFVFPFDPEQGFWTNPRMGRRHKPPHKETDLEMQNRLVASGAIGFESQAQHRLRIGG